MVSSEALEAKLIDRIAYSDEIGDKVRELLGHRVPLVDDVSSRQSETFGASRKVAIVYVDGDMTEGKSQAVPIFGIRTAGSETLARTLREVREDPRIGAVVLRIESPGGSMLAADTLWREIQLLQHTKPVAVSMGAVAASGGYYIASAAGRIFANPGTVTGSIGIFYGKVDVEQLLQRIGVSTDTIKTSPHADAESVFRPYTDEERLGLMKKISQYYEMFLTRVSLGRHLSRDAVDKAGQGRVFTGSQALGARLVDEMGGMRQAVEWARAAAHLSEDAVVVELPPIEGSFVGRLLGLEGMKVDGQVLTLLPAVAAVARQVGPMLVYSGDHPLARLEWTPLLP